MSVLADFERFLATAAKSGHEVRAYDDALDCVPRKRDAERRKQMLHKLFPGGAADPKLLGSLKVTLYPYQAEGTLIALHAG